MSVPNVDVAVVAVAESWPEHGRRERDLPSRAQVHSGEVNYAQASQIPE